MSLKCLVNAHTRFNTISSECFRHSKSNVRNRTQSNSIRGLSSIEFGNRTKSNSTLSVSSISEQIEFNRTNRTQSNSIDCVRLSSETELNRTQLRTFAPIVSAHPYCARESHATSCHVMHRARALSTKMNK